MRGTLSEAIQELATSFLGREITVVELRLYPYLDYVMKNDQVIVPSRVNSEERGILSVLRAAGHIEGGASGLGMTREFYDYINKVLWLGYVIVAQD